MHSMTGDQQQAQDLLLGGKIIGHGATAIIRESHDGRCVIKSFTVKTPFVNIRREVTIHKHLSSVRPHPNIIKFHSLFPTTITTTTATQQQQWHMVMERAVHGELFDRIEPDVGFPENVAQRYFAQLLAAVSHMHSEGIAHRDLKPENILLGGDGWSALKLADFGMATVYKNDDISGTGSKRRQLTSATGTRMYAAPEILRGEPYDGERVDVWSMGVILFVMLVGDVPWSEASEESLEYTQYTKSSRLPIFIGQDALNLLHQMLSVDPEKRISLDGIHRSDWMKNTVSTPPSLSHPDQGLTVLLPPTTTWFLSQPSKPVDCYELTGGNKFSVAGFTRESLLMQLSTCLSDLHCQVKIQHDKLYFGTIDKRNNKLTGLIMVSDDECQCEASFQKRRGDSIEFRRFFMIVAAHFKCS
jgi:serine/threonine protein kinase